MYSRKGQHVCCSIDAEILTIEGPQLCIAGKDHGQFTGCLFVRQSRLRRSPDELGRDSGRLGASLYMNHVLLVAGMSRRGRRGGRNLARGVLYARVVGAPQGLDKGLGNQV